MKRAWKSLCPTPPCARRALGLVFVLLCFPPATSAATDYVFFSVNGDTSATAMTQGDTVAWGANCDVGGALSWEIWYDVNSDGTIDMPGDLQLFTFVGTDGDTLAAGEGLPDISPAPDGWYITPRIILGLAPGQYIFKAISLADSSSALRTLVCTEMVSPPNTFSGHIIIPGHPAPDPAVLKNRWIQAVGPNDEYQVWCAMTNDSGRFQINVGSIGTGLTFYVSPPEIPGFAAPGGRAVLASGHTEGVDFLYGAPMVGETDYMFYSVNGDTSATSMTQGDSVAWGANCAIGGSLRWEIWYDLGGDGVIDVHDIQIVTFIATDGDTDGRYGPPDIGPIPDGWYITPPLILGLAPGHYIFKAVNLVDSTFAQKPLSCTEMASPPNTFSGHLIVPGHPAPDPAMLENRWVQAEAKNGENQIWAAMTNDSGNFTINVGSAGSGLLCRVGAPDIPGYVAPDAQELTASGHTDNVNFVYEAPADSIWGFLMDENSTVITRPVEITCCPMSGSGGKDVVTENGRYVFVFAASELGPWRIGCHWNNLIPQYLQPEPVDLDISVVHSLQLDFICPSSDTVLYARVTENGGPPVHRYGVYARLGGTGLMTIAVSDTGSNNVATLHISSLYGSGWGVYIDERNDDYPIPPGYTSVCSYPPMFGPGDLVDLCLERGFLVQDTIKGDPADPPVVWDSVWVTLDGHGQSPDSGGVFTFYVQSGDYWLHIYAPGYFINDVRRQVWVSRDTVGGLGTEINQAHCRIHGTLANVPLPLTGWVALFAHADTLHPGFMQYFPVDTLTGAYEFYLCDGEWTVEAPYVPDREAPAPVQLVIGNSPDTSRTLDLAYTIAMGLDESAGVPLPADFTLQQNYPNPFNPSTKIGYSVPSPGRVTIEIFNMLGQKVKTVVDDVKSAGYHGVEWGGTDDAGRHLSSGVYLCRMRAGTNVEVRKMLLLR